MDYKNINTASLPQDVAEVFNIIKTDTENFTNDLAIKAYSENLDKLMELINNKFPEAVTKTKLVVHQSIPDDKKESEQPGVETETKPQEIVASETSNLQAEIEGLKILMDIAETKAEKANLQAEIEGLQILIDIQ
jgi:hypothetical protein